MRPAHAPASAACGGRALYELYRAASRAAAPAVLLWRRMRGLEHPLRWPERLGRPSVSRPRPGSPLVWFHAVSLYEGMAVLPVVRHCARLHPGLPILLTTTTLSAFDVIKDLLPDVVIYQFAPLDCPDAIEMFIGYWKPSVILLMESELWPNLIMSAAEKGIAVALLNARMSLKSFNRWSVSLGLPLISLMLSKLSLVIPLSTVQAVRFQLLHTPPHKILFAGDLKYAVGVVEVGEKELNTIKYLQRQFNDRPIWMAASIHRGEQEGMGVDKKIAFVSCYAHGICLQFNTDCLVNRRFCTLQSFSVFMTRLIKAYPSLLLILVPRHPQDISNISLALRKQKVNFVLRSTMEVVSMNTRVYVVDTLGELRMLYRVSPIAVVGGSFLPSLSGHNFSEAAAAGCAVLTGPHVGHFYHMLVEMWQINPLAVKQLTGEAELLDVLKELLDDFKALEACQGAAKDAFSIMAHGVVNRVWNLVSTFAIDAQQRRGIVD